MFKIDFEILFWYFCHPIMAIFKKYRIYKVSDNTYAICTREYYENNYQLKKEKQNGNI